MRSTEMRARSWRKPERRSTGSSWTVRRSVRKLIGTTVQSSRRPATDSIGMKRRKLGMTATKPGSRTESGNLVSRSSPRKLVSKMTKSGPKKISRRSERKTRSPKFEKTTIKPAMRAQRPAMQMTTRKSEMWKMSCRYQKTARSQWWWLSSSS